jgi:uncharacterized protein
MLETYGYIFMAMAAWRHLELVENPLAVLELFPVKLAVGFGVLAAVVVAGAPFLEHRLLYHPDTERTSPKEFELAGVTERSIPAANGPDILMWWGAAQPGYPTILYFHGNAGSFGNRAERIRKYMARGYGVVMMTYRGYGGRKGHASERGNFNDAKSVYSALIESGIPAEQIIVYGESLGTGVATRLAAEFPVAGVILDAPYTSMVDVAVLHHPWLPSNWLMRDRYESKKYIGGVTAPLLVIHGEEDAIVPVEMGRKIFKAAGGPAEISTFKGAGHSDHHMFGSYDIIYDWLDRLRSGALTPTRPAP